MKKENVNKIIKFMAYSRIGMEIIEPFVKIVFVLIIIATIIKVWF